MIQKYVESASSYAADIDFVIMLVTVCVGVWFFAAEAIFFGFIIKFAAKEGVKAQYITGEDPKQKRWVTWPHNTILIFDVLIIVAAIKVWYHVKQEMPPPDETVQIIAQQWAWTFVHPGMDGKLGTADDIRTIDELHVLKDKVYHFELISRDVLHSFSVPVFRLKQDIIPGRIIRGWFKPTMTGQFDIQCTEICGIGHGLMPARIIIETPEQHRNWVLANTTVAATPPPAAGTVGGSP